MANRTTRTSEKDAGFLDSLRDGASISAACAAVGYARASAYEWRAADPEFSAAWDEAVEEGTDRMEDEAYRRAVQGTTKPIYQSGQRVGEVQEYSDTLMIFMMKARRPQKYKDRVAVGGDDGAPPIAVADVSDLERAKALAALIARTQATHNGG